MRKTRARDEEVKGVRLTKKVRTLRAQGVAAAEIARRLHAEDDLSAGEITTLTGESRQAVHAALQRTNARGRPPSGLVRVTASVPLETELWIREEAERRQCSIGDVVHAAISRARTAANKGERHG